MLVPAVFQSQRPSVPATRIQVESGSMDWSDGQSDRVDFPGVLPKSSEVHCTGIHCVLVQGTMGWCMGVTHTD